MATAQTRADLRDDVRAYTNIRSFARLPDGEINDELEEVHNELWDLDDWPQKMLTQTFTVDASGASPRPFDLVRVSRALIDGESVPPLDVHTAAANTTFGYSVSPFAILVHPTPVAPATVPTRTLTVVYETYAPDFLDDLAQPWMDAEFHRVYAYVAAARILKQRNGDMGKIQAFQERADRSLERMVRKYIRSHDTSTVKLGARW